jgi:hypothetical protein
LHTFASCLLLLQLLQWRWLVLKKQQLLLLLLPLVISGRLNAAAAAAAAVAALRPCGMLHQGPAPPARLQTALISGR